MPIKALYRIATVSLAIGGAAAPGHAQDAVAPFYRGKTINIVVGLPAGGSYDVYARLLARHLGKHLPGEPSVVVSNMPGGGSNIAATYVARVAAKDGTYIAAPDATQPLGPILEGTADLNYDLSRVNYLGSAASDDYICIVRPDAPAVTFDDMLGTQVIMGASGANSQTAMTAIMLNNVLGTKFKVVFGYSGTPEVTLAIQKGEIHGMCGLGWSSLKAQYPDLLKNGTIKIAVQVNDKGVPELNNMGVPLTVSYAHDERQRRILGIFYSQQVLARPYFVAAEVPADRLQILRRAFMESWRDPDLLAEAAKSNIDIGPAPGEEVQSLLQTIYASPPALLQSAKEAIKLK
jgi:tripartite-type tricarboxylate transporter receptor subunit TctC